MYWLSVLLCDCTMSRRVDFRELHARLRLRIARRGRKTVGDRIGADDEIFLSVKRLAGADHEVEP